MNELDPSRFKVGKSGIDEKEESSLPLYVVTCNGGWGWEVGSQAKKDINLGSTTSELYVSSRAELLGSIWVVCL